MAPRHKAAEPEIIDVEVDAPEAACACPECALRVRPGSIDAPRGLCAECDRYCATRPFRALPATSTRRSARGREHAQAREARARAFELRSALERRLNHAKVAAFGSMDPVAIDRVMRERLIAEGTAVAREVAQGLRPVVVPAVQGVLDRNPIFARWVGVMARVVTGKPGPGDASGGA